MNKLFPSLVTGALILSVFTIGSACGRYSSGDAAENADRFAERVGGVVVDVASEDSDNDGYASVTIRMPDGELVGAQCGTGHFRSSSCNSVNGCKLDSARSFTGR